MSPGTGYPSLYDYWSRTSTAMFEQMIEVNRAATSAFTRTASPSNSDERGARTEERVDPAGDLPEWDVERATDGETLSVGDRVMFSKRITEEDVDRFAAASGDTNPLHLDEEFAEETRFDGRIAHGALVTGTISAALARLPGSVVYLSQDTEFRAPVRIGDRVTADVEVVEALGGDRFRLRTTVDSEGEVVVDGEAVVLIDRTPEGD
jgi:3-hydroxybutyryl-CoA dehydratase